MNELLIYGEIGWDVNAADIATRLGELDGGDLTIRVNSPGGDVHGGLAIMNSLRGYAGKVTAVVEGLAASAASFIIVGGADRVVVRPGAEIMVHDAWTYADGNAAEMEKSAADLNRLSGTLAGIYAAKAGGTADEWRDIMRAETWFTADEAVAAGLADAVEDARTAEPEDPAAVAARSRRAGVMARFRYAGRRAAPAPTINSPSGHERKEGGMSALADLARELGQDEKKMRAALARFFAEEVTVTSTVDISYPEESTVVPTGSVTISPTGEVPPGLTFTVGEAPEGWTAEVEETTGVLTVTAPAGAEPDDEVELTVTATGTEAVDLTVPVTVTAAGGGEPEDPAPAAPADPGTLTTLVDSARLAELEEAAAYGRAAMERDHEAKAQAFADAAFRDNKIGASARKRWAAAWLADREDAETRMAQIPAGTVHRAEAGHARTDKAAVDQATAEREERVRRSLNR